MTPNILNRLCDLIRNPKTERHFKDFFMKRLDAFNIWKNEIEIIKDLKFLNTRADCEKTKNFIAEKLN